MKIIVLLGTFNGEKYLKAQLDSLVKQTCLPAKIIIRDDGSSDNTHSILSHYCQKFNFIDWLKDEAGHVGVKNNYAILFNYAIKYNANFILISDQDDVWLPRKIENTLTKIKKMNQGQPALVFSDAKIADEHLNIIHPSFTQFQKLSNIQPLALKKLLLYSPALGCTMMFNQALLELIVHTQTIDLNPDKCLLVLAALKGSIDYLPEPTLLYRQHGSNVTGALHGIKRKLWTLENKNYLQTRYQTAIDQARSLSRAFSLEKKETYVVNHFTALFTASYPVRILNYFRFCLTPPHWKRKVGLLLSLFFKYK